MTIMHFFDPYNVKHLKAYEVLSNTGAWPPDFIPENMGFEPVWMAGICAKMAEAWIEQAKVGHIFGMPSFDQ